MRVILIIYFLNALYFFILWTYRAHNAPWNAAANDFKFGTRLLSALFWPLRLWVNFSFDIKAKKMMKQFRQTEEAKASEALLEFNNAYNVISQTEFENFLSCLVDKDFMNEKRQEAFKNRESFSYEIWLFKYIAQSLEKALKEGRIHDPSLVHAYYYCLKKLVENEYTDANGVKWTKPYIYNLSNTFKKEVDSSNINH